MRATLVTTNLEKELSVYLLNCNKMESPDLSNLSASRIRQAIPTHWTDGCLTSTPNGTLMDGNGDLHGGDGVMGIKV
jgi:hypothetical protein